MTTNIGTIKPVKIEDEMRGSYLDYAMSVIVSRALPDVRDGLKPVHRRILYAMNDLSLRSNSPYKKSARIVGEVLGKYHPHGDTSVYDAMVRMAQGFSMRYALIDGQGNFGSVDNDPPAAMRYTEARMTRISEEMLTDIEKNTVDFVPNFDSSLQEPTVLPAQLPILLLNGTSGIAVGMTTSIPPHNLGELCDAIVKLIENADVSLEELLEIVKGPDFPTAGIIMGKEGIRSAYTTGHGKAVIRARASTEESTKGGRSQIIVTELPYQTNKAVLVEKIAELAKGKKIEGIAEVRDESDRDGIRVVIDLKREGQAAQVLNNLYKHTAMQSTFFINMLALVNGQPRVIGLKATLQHFIDFRREIVVRRSQFDLKKAEERAHILEGLKKALDQLDAVIATIKQSHTADEARNNLMQFFGLSQEQAQAILDMQLRRIAALEREKISDEYKQLTKTIKGLEGLLTSPEKILFLIRDEILDLKNKYADERLTELREEEAIAFKKEDLVPHQEVAVTISQRGYVKRLPRDTYKMQHRGGKGIVGMVTREADAVQHLIIADTHNLLLFFTNRGRMNPLKCYDLPSESSRTAKGLPLVNLIPLEETERITALIPIKDFAEDLLLLMTTRNGLFRRTPLKAFANARINGIRAIILNKDDELVSVRLAPSDSDVVIVTEKGQSIRFNASTVPLRSRNSRGVKGIRLDPGDKVVSMDVVRPESYLLTITRYGYGKLTNLRYYRPQRRAGRGLRTFKTNAKTGLVATATVVEGSEELMLISRNGKIVSTSVEQISVQSRITQGVSIMRLGEDDSVAAIACFDRRNDRDKSPVAETQSKEKPAAEEEPQTP